MRWVCKDGGTVHFSMSLRWLPAQRRVYASARDISASQAVQEELHKSRNRLPALVETMGGAFFAVARDWRFTYVNRKTMAFVGRPHQSLLGAHPVGSGAGTAGQGKPGAVPPGDGERPQQHLRDRASANRNLARDPGLSARGWAVGLFHDVTARYLAEKVIRESEQRLRDIIAMTSSGYLLAGCWTSTRPSAP